MRKRSGPRSSSFPNRKPPHRVAHRFCSCARWRATTKPCAAWRRNATTGCRLWQRSSRGPALQSAQAIQCLKYLRLVLDFSQGAELFLDVAPVELVLMPDRDPFGIMDVLRARREKLQDNQVLGRTCPDLEAGPDGKRGRATDQ